MDEKPFTPEWFRRKFVETATQPVDLVRFLQQQGVAIDATKLSKSMSEKRTRRIQPEEMGPIWKFFNLPPDEMMSGISGKDFFQQDVTKPPTQAAMPNAGLPEKIIFDKSTMPILGKSLGSHENARVLFNGQELGRVDRPGRLANVRSAYAAYVHGTSMEPRYEAGELVLVNPEKPVGRNHYVVAQIHDNDSDPPYGYVKKFISFSSKELVLEQLNPPEDEDEIMRFPRNRVVSVHKIVGTLDE